MKSRKNILTGLDLGAGTLPDPLIAPPVIVGDLIFVTHACMYKTKISLDVIYPQLLASRPLIFSVI